ncbi:HAMP domain-containing sensor histidine kinase [Mailhella massiliensis]|uniref:histidine kinase n=1 Tax=Mailhella massiliensis TaxID=1903261 RepID=A0A921AXL9_9BACT|nr:HAMP domain-containing sensor histidine kinase [Mailhella massiliensis]HJD97959.1 HAMP domain-containing histidine kinase [Mailhella massiliensis]
MYIPDSNRQIHNVLVVMESDRVDGYGLFFDVNALCLLVAAILGVSFLWWLPFVHHLSRPLRRMARYADEMEFETFSLVDKPFLHDREFSGARKDEIGRVGYALVAMTQRINRMLTGQRQFIRYVAHELNTPLAKAQMGLGVLECKLEGDERLRVQQVLRHIKRLSVLTEEVIAYLQAKAAMRTPREEPVELAPFLASIIQGEAQGEEILLEVDAGLCLCTDREYLQRSVGNLLRNALHYAAGSGPVLLRAGRKDMEIEILVADQGPGVPEEDLPSLCEPFFRGRAAVTHPGGTGLGLSIVKYCTEACGGRMEYGNRKPRGFAVSLCFPVRKKKDCCRSGDTLS